MSVNSYNFYPYKTKEPGNFSSKKNIKPGGQRNLLHKPLSLRLNRQFNAVPLILPFKSNRISEKDEKYIESLAASVGCKPRQLRSVAGPDELKSRLKKSKPGNFNPANSETGKFNINLHLHTTASDGEFTPETLFEEVSKQVKNMRKNGKNDDFMVAVTDHDTMDGVKNALEYIAKNSDKMEGIRFVPGIEINAKYENPEILTGPARPEILVYCVNPYEGRFFDFMKSKRNSQRELIGSIVQEAGEKLGIRTEDFGEFSKNNKYLRVPMTGTIDYAMGIYLKNKGVDETNINSFLGNKKWFVDNHITAHTPSVQEILENTGKNEVASIAHPIRINFMDKLKDGTTEGEALLDFFKDFKSMGGYAAEGNYQFDPDVEKWIYNFKGLKLKEKEDIVSNLCKIAGLKESGGVDNHGSNLLKRM